MWENTLKRRFFTLGQGFWTPIDTTTDLIRIAKTIKITPSMRTFFSKNKKKLE
jgi:hypothetical protein